MPHIDAEGVRGGVYLLLREKRRGCRLLRHRSCFLIMHDRPISSRMEERAAYRATGGVPPALETKEVEEQRHAAGEARHDNTDADFREGGPMLVHSNVLALLAAVLVITHTPV